MIRKIFFIIAILLLSAVLLAQDDAYTPEEQVAFPNENKKTKSMGIIPIISFNSDLGFQYGGIVNLYSHGVKNNVYPYYRHSLYFEASRYTLGSGIYKIFYDSKYLIPKTRISVDIGYHSNDLFSFFGFNGYDSFYSSNFIDRSSTEYITNVFYKQKNNILRLNGYITGKLFPDLNINWAAGINSMNFEIDKVDINKLNKNKVENLILPDTASLFEHYCDWGLIPNNEAKGGFYNALQFGLIYDTRNSEPSTTKGIWSEIVLFNCYGNNQNFGKLAITHRQYFSLIDNYLSMAYRIGYLGMIYGKAPNFLYPHMVFSYSTSSAIEGLGGSKSIRGMMSNRTVGKDIAYSNLEFRCIFAKFSVFKQNIMMVLNPFFDAGMVVRKIDVDMSKVPEIYRQKFFRNNAEKIHLTYGCGMRFVLNENFIVACDFGLPVNKQDGGGGLYIGMNWLF